MNGCALWPATLVLACKGRCSARSIAYRYRVGLLVRDAQRSGTGQVSAYQGGGSIIGGLALRFLGIQTDSSLPFFRNLGRVDGG